MIKGREQQAHFHRLYDELAVLPCSPRCANWMLYGVQPDQAKKGLTPGRCKGKVHQPATLRYTGRRCLVSRNWSNKTLTDHRLDGREWFRAVVTGQLGDEADAVEGAALSAAVRAELITSNPAVGHLDLLRAPATTADEDPQVWEPEETARFLEQVAGDRLAALYELAAYAGLRRGELCALRWSDIDDDGIGLTVRQAIVEVTRSQVTAEQIACPTCGLEHVGRLLKRPKSRSGRRWVPLARLARDALARHRQEQQAERDYLGVDYQDHDLVFADFAGLPLRPGSVTSAFEAHMAACGLPVIRLHDTRHGACSLLLAGGVPIEVVQMILGHASPEVTRKVYAHVMRKITAAQVEQATQLLTQHRPRSLGEDETGAVHPAGNQGSAVPVSNP
jgi:integrase